MSLIIVIHAFFMQLASLQSFQIERSYHAVIYCSYLKQGVSEGSPLFLYSIVLSDDVCLVSTTGSSLATE